MLERIKESKRYTPAAWKRSLIVCKNRICNELKENQFSQQPLHIQDTIRALTKHKNQAYHRPSCSHLWIIERIKGIDLQLFGDACYYLYGFADRQRYTCQRKNSREVYCST